MHKKSLLYKCSKSIKCKEDNKKRSPYANLTQNIQIKTSVVTLVVLF